MRLHLLRSHLSRNPHILSSLLQFSPLPSKFSSCSRLPQASFHAAIPSMDYSESGFKRPDTIPWQTCHNHIKLIGVVSDHVFKKYVNRGAVTMLKVEEEDMRFKLLFWDELADIAAAHLKRDDRIFVSGSVFVSYHVGKDNLPKTTFEVNVKDLKYVLANNPSYVEAEGFGKLESHICGQSSSRKGNLEDQWQELFNNPSQWWDSRFCKKTPRHPDFKNKMTGDALWIKSFSTPAWVKERLQGQEKISTIKTTPDLEILWQAFFANPFEWWDNRNSKKTPLNPDFRHKKTGEALWIDNVYNPAWVKSQLAALDTKAQKAMEQGKGGGLLSSKERVKHRSTFRDEDLGFY